MKTTQKTYKTAIEVANQVERWIRNANLKPGTLLKKTTEIAKEYKVSTYCANMAMRLLVHRHLVIRRPHVGTLVAEHRTLLPSPIKTIVLLMPTIGFTLPPEEFHNLILGLQSVFPTAMVEFIDSGDSDSHLHELLKGKAGCAIILAGAPLSLQRLVYTTELPCVVLGHPFPTVNLPWVDVDSSRMGELAANCVLEHQKVSALLLMHNRIAPGDHLFMGSLKQTLRNADWNISRLTEWFVPSDPEVVEHRIKEYLHNHRDPCTVITSTTNASTVFKAVEQLQMEAEVSVVGLRGINRTLKSPAKYTVIDWKIDLFGLGNRLGEQLLRRIEKGKSFCEKSVFSLMVVPRK